jgi:hypothetical protein
MLLPSQTQAIMLPDNIFGAELFPGITTLVLQEQPRGTLPQPGLRQAAAPASRVEQAE